MGRKKFIDFLREGYYFAIYSIPGSGEPDIHFVNSRLHMIFFPYLFSSSLIIIVLINKFSNHKYYIEPIIAVIIMVFLFIINKLIFNMLFGVCVEKGLINEQQEKKQKIKKGIIAFLFFIGGFMPYIILKSLL